MLNILTRFTKSCGIFCWCSIGDGGGDLDNHDNDDDDDDGDDDESDDNVVVTRSAAVCPLDPTSQLPGFQQHCISALCFSAL